MKALISGQAATAVLIDGQQMSRLDLDQPSTSVPCAPADLPRVFADVDDLVELNDTSREDAMTALERLWERDRAMHLALILLDKDADRETRTAASECLDECLQSEDVADFVADRLFSRPLPSQADAAGAVAIARAVGAERAGAFVGQLDNAQPYIIRPVDGMDLADAG